MKAFLNSKSKETIEKLPTTTGVYLFYENPSTSSGQKKPIYIGKAINIKERVKNHFFQPTYKDDLYLQKIESIKFIETGSEIEALVLEASLIKKHQPKFNAVWRDDKNYFYIAVAKNNDKIPYIFITHQPKKVLGIKYQVLSAGQKRIPNTKYKILNTQYIGPFTEGNALKKTLKFLRKVFPYYTNAKHPATNCTWCHLELCPGPVRNTARASAPEGPVGRAVSNGARSYANLVQYKKNIKKLTLILQGKRKTVLYSLKKEMTELSKQNKFEEARQIRDKISALEQVIAHTNVIENSKSQITNHNKIDEKWTKTEKILREIIKTKTPVSKIECYDISNIQGTQAVGSMVVFVNGKPDKSQYKKFRIRMENKPNDIAMLGEVLTRRLGHPEWGYPQVMLIDGGIAQLNVGIKSKLQFKDAKNVKIISIAKGKQELLIESASKIPLKNLPQEIYNLIVHLDDEAHRFAITYHKKLRKKYLLT